MTHTRESGSCGSVPTRTDLSVHVRIFSKIRIFGLLYGFFFKETIFIDFTHTFFFFFLCKVAIQKDE